MAGEGNSWGPWPSEGDTRLATGLSMVSPSQAAPTGTVVAKRGAVLQGHHQPRARTSAQQCDALLWPGQTDRHFQGSLELLLQGRYIISLLDMNPRPGHT